MQVISIPESYYPNWDDHLERNFGDKLDHVKWRSKQNLDAMYLMLYVYKQSPTFYLMLEDDIVSSKDYLKIIYQVGVFLKVFMISDVLL